jgi:pimeloyl-ACP methyl ester carboxylesterase
MTKAVQKLVLVASLALLLVAVGLWLRPVSFFNAYSYLRLYGSGGKSDSVYANGLRIHYDVAGRKDGSVVVLVHGLGGRAEDWENMSPYLVHAGYRIYMLDLPGFGRSERPATFSYSVKDQAAAVIGFMDALDLKQVDLGGWSMGGWIVQLVASAHPERIRQLILFDSAGLAQMPSWDTHLFTPTSIEEFHHLQSLLMPDPPSVPDFISRDIVRRSQDDAWVAHRAVQTMLTGTDTTDALLPRLKMPVLIVWDKDDQVFPLSQGETIHRLIPQSRLEVVSGCGHLDVIQCAGQISPGVVEFLKDE